MLAHNGLVLTSGEKAKLCALDLRKAAEEAYFDTKKKFLNARSKKERATYFKDLQKHLTEIKIVVPDAERLQKKMAEELKEAYSEGSRDTPIDSWEAKKYENLVKKLETELSRQPLISAVKKDPSLWQLFKQTLKENFRTNSIYTATGWYTAIRLFIIYLNRIFANLEKYDMNKFHKFLPKWYAVLGLSYGLTFFLDCAIVLYSTFRKPKPEEANLSRWMRFKNVLKKGNRPFRLANDGVWFAVNMIGIFLTGGLSIIISLAGFCFDEVHEIFKPAYRGFRHQQVSNKLQNEINNLQKKIKQPTGDSAEDLSKLGSESQRKIIKENKENIKKDINILSYLNAQQKKQTWTTIKNGFRPVFGTTLILIGMGLILFPPTSAPAALFIGVGLTIVGGSIFTGLFYRIYDFIQSKMPSKKAEEPFDLAKETGFVEEEAQKPDLSPFVSSTGKTIKGLPKEAPTAKDNEVVAREELSGSLPLPSNSPDNDFLSSNPLTLYAKSPEERVPLLNPESSDLAITY